MTRHILDNPAHAALTTRHARFAQVHGRARRYDPGIVPFAACDPDAADDLAALVRPGEAVGLVHADGLTPPDGFDQELRGNIVQMIATRAIAAPDDPRIVPLGPADAAEMTALAAVTRPGPFTDRAQEIGRFWGIRDAGRLVAMAGQRMATDGHVELSGVCTAEEARGQGLARILSCHVAAQIARDGDVPFLHAYDSNTAAVTLYQRIGFAIRQQMDFGVFRRRG